LRHCDPIVDLVANLNTRGLEQVFFCNTLIHNLCLLTKGEVLKNVIAWNLICVDGPSGCEDRIGGSRVDSVVHNVLFEFQTSQARRTHRRTRVNAKLLPEYYPPMRSRKMVLAEPSHTKATSEIVNSLVGFPVQPPELLQHGASRDPKCWAVHRPQEFSVLDAQLRGDEHSAWFEGAIR
jgi:hypothetical protein